MAEFSGEVPKDALVLPLSEHEEGYYKRYPEQLAHRLSPEYAKERAAYQARLAELAKNPPAVDSTWRYPDALAAVSGEEKE